MEHFEPNPLNGGTRGWLTSLYNYDCQLQMSPAHLSDNLQAHTWPSVVFAVRSSLRLKWKHHLHTKLHLGLQIGALSRASAPKGLRRKVHWNKLEVINIQILVLFFVLGRILKKVYIPYAIIDHMELLNFPYPVKNNFNFKIFI